MKKYVYVLWIMILSVSLVGCSKQEDCDPNDEESPCYAGVAKGGTGLFECSYKVTINGQTATHNQFGKDKLVLQSSRGNVDAEAVLFMLSQAKMKPQEAAVLTFMAYGTFDSKVPAQATYPISLFQSTSLTSPSVLSPPIYGYPDGEKNKGKMILTLLENSDQRIRLKATGTVMHWDEIGNGIGEIGLVPVEVEITIGRKHYNEVLVNGVFTGGAVCDCQ